MVNRMANGKVGKLLVTGAFLTALVVPGQLLAKNNSSGPALDHRGDRAQSDAWLTPQVRHQLLMLPYYSVFDNLEYRVSGDRVELLGQVVNPSLKSDAEAAVKHIEGVQQVFNRIEVLPPSPNDDRIRLICYRMIYSQPMLSKYAIEPVPPIHIIVKNGDITLVGFVDTPTDSQVAYMQASSVPGAFTVTNNLKVEGNGRKA